MRRRLAQGYGGDLVGQALRGMYLRIPVVPIAVDSGTLSPRKAGIWKSGTITYKVGEELPTGLPRAEIEARVHAAINALNV